MTSGAVVSRSLSALHPTEMKHTLETTWLAVAQGLLPREGVGLPEDMGSSTDAWPSAQGTLTCVSVLL